MPHRVARAARLAAVVVVGHSAVAAAVEVVPHQVVAMVEARLEEEDNFSS